MILLVAATGYTGRLVARQLVRLGASVRLGGRDLQRVHQLNQELGQNFECARVDVKEESTLHEAMDGCKVVINCAGPFTVLGEPVVSAAIRAGAHYLDTTGEQPFIRQVFEKYGSAARESGCALVPACAFEYAIGDAASALMNAAVSSDSVWENIEIRYAFKGVGTSRGTQKSVLKVLGLPAVSLKDEKLLAIGSSAVCTARDSNMRVDASILKNIDSKAVSMIYKELGRKDAFVFPGGEVFLVPLHMKVRNLTTLISSDLPAPLLA
ncbi:MAG: saccharopine dehydrogenase NADP-binding domain-containing protein, partial [Cyanobacteria bacterium]|nr:saccharopine dehydrogenase NADP-binding domain-containing protein [Cyanobacteriota bacterium]